MGCGGSKVKEREFRKEGNTVQLATSEVSLKHKVTSENRRQKGMPFKFTLIEKTEDNLVVDLYYGILEDNSNFEDCLIRSEEDLSWRLRTCIALFLHEINCEISTMKPEIKIHKNNRDQLLLTRYIFDFSKICVVAIRGAHISKVTVENEVYLVYITEEIVASNEYCAAVVNLPDFPPPSSWEFASVLAPGYELINSSY